MWVGWAQLTMNQSGPPAASTASTASRSGVPSGSLPSVSTVKPIATGMPARPGGGRPRPSPPAGWSCVIADTRSAPAAAKDRIWWAWYSAASSGSGVSPAT